MTEPSNTGDSHAPAISVVIPAYGVAGYIRETVDTVLAQTFPDWELIVVNDGSPDTRELEAALASYRTRLTYLGQPNRGAAAARNAGILAARGEWIAFLDGDDLWLPAYLEKQLGRLGRGDLDMVWCNGHVIDERGASRIMATFPRRENVSAADLLREDVTVFTSATVVRRRSILEVGLFDETLRRAQDYDLWVRLAFAGARIGYQSVPLFKYRKRPGSLSGDALTDVRRSMVVYERLLEKLQGEPDLARIIREKLQTYRFRERVVLGKRAIEAGNYDEARACLRLASSVRLSWKVVATRGCLTLWPQAARWMVHAWGKRRRERGS